MEKLNLIPLDSNELRDITGGMTKPKAGSSTAYKVGYYVGYFATYAEEMIGGMLAPWL